MISLSNGFSTVFYPEKNGKVFLATVSINGLMENFQVFLLWVLMVECMLDLPDRNVSVTNLFVNSNL